MGRRREGLLVGTDAELAFDMLFPLMKVPTVQYPKGTRVSILGADGEQRLIRYHSTRYEEWVDISALREIGL